MPELAGGQRPRKGIRNKKTHFGLLRLPHVILPSFTEYTWLSYEKLKCVVSYPEHPKQTVRDT